MKAAAAAMPLLLAGCLAPSRVRTIPYEKGPDRPPTVALQCPLRDARVLSRFGPRHGRPHQGLDVRGPRRRGGDPVLAAADGTVVERGVRRGYGNTLLLRHADGSFTRYAHLRSFQVGLGDRVRAGQALGAVGATGRATSPHLHFEVLTPALRPVDPGPVCPNGRQP